MKWEKVKIKEICSEIISGGTPKSNILEFYYPKEIPWLKTKEVNYCQIYDTEMYISKKGLEKSSAKLLPVNSVIVAMYGQGNTAGRVAINKIPLCTNQACCNLIINNKIADYKYVYYSLVILYDKLVSLKNGGAQPNLNVGIIKDIEIPLPKLQMQKKITSILSAYDELIENNQKQIKLLEEAAQRLYKEWFVDLRFPGYEKTTIIDGVPEGWEILTLDKISCRLEAGSRPKGGIDKTRKSGIVSIGAENVLGLGKYNFNDEKFIPNDYYLKMKKGKIVDKDILIYKDGAYIGKTTLFQNGYPHKEAAVNEHVFLLHMKNEYLQYFVFFTLYQHKYFLKMQQLNKNAAQPGINLKSLLSLDILVPSYKLIEQYNFIITPIMNDIFEKAKQNIKLVEIRNKLLQKLMSGEIEV